MITPADLAILLAWAAALGGYQIPGYLPALAIRPAEFFPSTSRDCGYYDRGVLYLREGLMRETAEVCAVHELTHFLQEKAGKVYVTCVEKKEREDEAYMVQRKFAWLAQARQLPPVPFLVARC